MTAPVQRVVETVLPTDVGAFRALGYREPTSGREHLALVRGDIAGAADRGVLTRLHVECLTGDAFTSGRCACGPRLRSALGRIAAEGTGVVVYLRTHEGRGTGLVDQLRAYARHDRGADDVDADRRPGPPAEAYDYRSGVEILRDLGVRTARLLGDDHDEVAGLLAGGLEVREQVAAVVPSASGDDSVVGHGQYL